MACTISQCFLCGSTNHSFTACTEREDLLVTISKTGRVGGYGRVWVMDKGPRRATPSLMPQSWHSRGHVKSKAFYDARDVLPTAEVFDECCCSVCGLERIGLENENVKEENRIVQLMPCLCSEKEGSSVKDLATVQCAACGEIGHAFCARPVISGTERRKRAIEAKERDAKRLKEEAEAEADEDVETGGTTRRGPVLVPLRHVYNGGCIEDPSILKEVAAVIGKNEDENLSQEEEEEEEDDDEEEWGSCFNCGGSGHSGSHCGSSKLEAFGAVGPHMDMELRGNEYYSSAASGYSGGFRREVSYGGGGGGGSSLGYDETRERDRAREKGRSSEWVNFGDDVEGGSRNSSHSSSHSSSRFSRNESSSSGQSTTSVPLPPGMPVAQRQQQIQSLVNDFERQWKDKSVLKYQPPQQYPHQIVQQHYQQQYQQNYQQQQQPQQRIVIQRSWERQPQILQQQQQQQQQQQHQNNYQQLANPFLQQTTMTPFLEYQNEGVSSSGPAAKKGRKNRWKDA